MICSSVYRDRYIRPSPSGPDSTSSWLIFRGACQRPLGTEQGFVFLRAQFRSGPGDDAEVSAGETGAGLRSVDALAELECTEGVGTKRRSAASVPRFC